MSYHVYTTEGIIVKRAGFGEANILVHVLTENLGLIVASARSARLSVSKLRPALQEYSIVSLSCVKGKGGWKITNVAGKGNVFFEYPKHAHAVIAQISKVLMQMIPGESAHPEIFRIVKEAFTYLREVPQESMREFEAVLLLRILFELGYVAKNEDVEEFLSDATFWSAPLLSVASPKRPVLVSLINKALKESQL